MSQDDALMQVSDDDHDDDDHDHDDHDEMDLHEQRRGMSDVLLDSWRYVEVAALTVPDSPKHHHAIGARLGGTNVDSTRLHSPSIGRQRRQTTPFSSPMVTSRSPVGRTTVDEKTKLLSQAAEQLKQEYGEEVREDDKADEVEEDKEQQLQSPALTQWIFVALVCAMCYALYNISIKKGSATIHPILGGVILQFIAALLGLILLCIMVLHGQSENKIHYDRHGILWSIGAGLWVGTAEMVSFYVSSIGVPATQFIPIIIGGSVLFGSILGVFTLQETILWRGWSGVLLLCIGIGLVATDHDPGEEKVQEGGGDNEDVEDLEIVQQPPLLVWIGPALFCALAYALYNICIKKGSASINPIVGAVILQFVAALYGTCILLIIVVITVNNNSPPPAYDRHGILWACWAGIFVGMAELLSFCVSGMGVQASQSIPIIIGGSVGFGAVLGIIMLHEELEIIPGWSGVILLMTGIALVATDPGEKVEGH